MKKYLSLLVAIAVTLFSFSSFAFTPPAKPANGWYVLDQVGKLSTDQVNQLNHKIEALNKNTKNEYAVVILSTLDGAGIEQAAQDTFRAWGVGKKGLNNGVMLMISVGDRKTRLQTGKGAEGDLPDLLCNDILAKTLRPRLKAGQWYEGVNETLDAVSSHVEDHTKQLDALNKTNSTATSSHSSGCDVSAADTGRGAGTLFVLLLAGAVGLFIGVRRKIKRDRERQAREEQKQSLIIREAEWEQALRSRQRVQDEQRALNMAQAREREVAATRTFVPAPMPAMRTSPVVLSSGTPRIPRPEGSTSPTVKSSGLSTGAKIGIGVAAAAGAAAAAELLRKREEDAARRRREEEEAQASRRRREDESNSVYVPTVSTWDSGPSSTSYDSGSSSGCGGFDSGSSFGGGDSGGGGASSDW